MKRKTNTIDFVEFPSTSVNEITESKLFYENVFGWSFKEWGENYIDTEDSGLACGFNADREHKPAKPLAVIYTEDLSLARSKVIAAGGVITKEIFSFPGGRRFHFTDPAANELAVWSDK